MQSPRRRAGVAARRRPATSPSRTTRSILLFMCCHPALTPAVGDRADAARGRRPDHGRDRQRVPGARSDDGAAHQPRQADASRASGVPFRMPTDAASARERLDAVLHVLYLIFNEGYASSSGAEPAARRPVERGDPADARGARAAAGRRRGGRAARADAADRRAPRRAHRPGRRADPARRAGPHAVGSRRRSPRASRSSADALLARSGRRRTSCRRRSPRCTTRRRAPRTPTGRRSSRSTAC